MEHCGSPETSVELFKFLRLFCFFLPVFSRYIHFVGFSAGCHAKLSPLGGCWSPGQVGFCNLAMSTSKWMQLGLLLVILNVEQSNHILSFELTNDPLFYGKSDIHNCAT